ncbi:MAG TPA: copper amine oxidase N-terminal domain-containing protein [Epulopiscium sp.]|nr:copper amine oxidase N-terminal domain-containing protein [Candidatus Epulonipiscium sp.]
MKTLKNKKFIRKCTTVFVGTLLLTTVVQATSLTKKIDATFKNIQVYYNNQQKTMAQEPFLYNGSVYLPVRAVSELVDKNVDWNSSTNSVFVTDKGGVVSSDLEAQIATKNFEITKLMTEKNLLQKKVTELEAAAKTPVPDKDKVTSGDLKETLSYIEKHFDYKHSIDWDFKLSETGSRINVDVGFDSRYDDTKWERLTKSEREAFFRDVAREIRVDFKNAVINGSVIDRRTDKTIGTFSYSQNNTFSYNDNGSTSFTTLQKDLKNRVKIIDGTSIPIDDIIIKGTGDDITFTVYIDLYSRTLQNEWADAMRDNPRKVRLVMEYIQEETLRDFKYATIQGFIEDVDSRNTLAKFDGRSLY